VHTLEVCAVPAVGTVARKRPEQTGAVAGQRLDLHHVGTVVGQQHGAIRPRQHVTQIYDAHTLERAPVVHNGIERSGTNCWPPATSVSPGEPPGSSRGMLTLMASAGRKLKIFTSLASML